MENKLIVTTSPHITARETTRGLMLNVVFALLPTVIAAGLIFGWRAWLVAGVCTGACVGFEALYNVVMKRDQSVGDMSAVVTGLILACNLPSTLPLWMAIVGAFVAIIVVKMLFGGLGFNFANPALVGRIVLFLSFTAAMTNYGYPAVARMDALAGATPLVASNSVAGSQMLLPLLFGVHGGVLGETCALTLLLGGVYLIVTKTIAATIPCSYLGGYYVLYVLYRFFSEGMELASIGGIALDGVAQLMMGGLLLGAFFMATDYVTSPYTPKAQILFGIGLAAFTFLIREFGNMAEGVSFSLLLMNLVVPYLNKIRRTPLGGAKKK